MNEDERHLKSPPFSRQAEEGVIGGIMLTDGRALAEVMDLITEKDFFAERTRTIYQAIIKLDSRNAATDPISVCDQLQIDSKLDVAGGSDYIASVVETTPSAANIRAYAKIIVDRSLRRQLIQASRSIYELSEDSRSVEEVLSDAQRMILNVGVISSSEGPRPISSWVPGFIDTLDTRQHREEKLMGISTGFKDLDKKINGLQRGSLIVLAGRPSMGKTTLALNIAKHVSVSQELPVVVFSMEMTGEELLHRMVSQVGKVPLQALLSGDLTDSQWTDTVEAIERMGTLEQLSLDESPTLLISQIKARCRRVKQQHGKLGLVVIDYLQLMSNDSRSDNRAQQIAEITRGLKTLAKELDVPVMILSQLNRDVDKREDKHPRLSDLRESGSIEQDADVVLFVYRGVVYNENVINPKVSEIIVAKQRNGPIGIVLLYFFGEYTMFGQMEAEDQRQFWGDKLGNRKQRPARRGDEEPF